jgi:hypothetical protein
VRFAPDLQQNSVFQGGLEDKEVHPQDAIRGEVDFQICEVYIFTFVLRSSGSFEWVNLHVIRGRWKPEHGALAIMNISSYDCCRVLYQGEVDA